ncbi:MAG: hypothetical protein WAU86_19990 [Oricola sp.]
MALGRTLRGVGGIVLPTAVLMSLGGCDLMFPQRDILDAARLYEENPKAFNRIRLQYPGPFTEPKRVPEFDDVDNEPGDVAFLEELRQSIPAEILVFYSWGKGGPDVIRVVVGTYGIAVSGSVVAVAYFERFPRDEIVQKGVEVFDKCDERALAWLEKTARQGPYADVYCRLDEHWYAYQSIT